ncbi:hypothetical protein PC116_g29974, partial [Phytophthora cactorum]
MSFAYKWYAEEIVSKI